MPHQNGTLKYEELIRIPKNELIQNIDTQLGLNRPDQLLRGQLYINELVRRDQDKATKRILRLTWAITFLTVVLVGGLGIQIYLAWK